MDEHRGAMSGAFYRRHVAQRAGTSYGSRTGRSTVGGRRADHAVAFDDVESLDVDSKSLATAAQAEDRAGFAMEVLAARNSGHATLDISDRHKTTSQRFASFSDTIDDRRKTYEATALLAHPDTMLDSATGLTAPTDATIEMNCARSEITAIAGSSNAANDHSQSRVTNANSRRIRERNPWACLPV